MHILIADDHHLVRRGLKNLLQGEFPSASIEETGDAEAVIKKSLVTHWDVVICDLSMPGKGGLDVVQHMKQHFPKTPVLILSMYPEEQYAVRALKTGAAGYLSKDAAPRFTGCCWGGNIFLLLLRIRWRGILLLLRSHRMTCYRCGN